MKSEPSPPDPWAWENPPGERIGAAIAKKFLNPHAETAQTFVA
jgi:hypothetical protein